MCLRAMMLICAAAAASLPPSAQPLAGQLSEPLDSAMVASLRWRSIGPANMSGRVTDVEGIPSPSKTFYVATAAGGIWKTTNNGTSFKSLFSSERVVAMGDLAIAPSDHSIIWAGTGEVNSRNSISPGQGIYKSTDAGESWELMGLEGTQTIGRVLVHPTNPDRVYVAALGAIWNANPERGLYRTDDGGQTWDLVKFISDRAGFVDMVMHPRNPDVLFASSWERVRSPFSLSSGGPGSALWKTIDGGDTWTEVVGGRLPHHGEGPYRDRDFRIGPRRHVRPRRSPGRGRRIRRERPLPLRGRGRHLGADEQQQRGAPSTTRRCAWTPPTRTASTGRPRR